MDGTHPTFDGTSNLRDLGGMPTRDGARVRRGHIFRSAHVDDLSKAGRTTLQDAGIKLIVDFRGVDEAAQANNDTASERLHLPIEPTIVKNLQAVIAADENDEEGVHLEMEAAYRRFVTDRADVFRRYLTRLLEPNAFAFLIHCTAGKDRTGVAIALILSALDVEYDDIQRDYLLSNSMLHRDPAITATLPKAMVDVLFGVNARYLDASFGAIEEGWGSVDTYLTEAMGIGPDEQAYLKDNLTS